MHRIIERVIRPETATPGGDLLLVLPEKVGSVASELQALSAFVQEHESSYVKDGIGSLFAGEYIQNVIESGWPYSAGLKDETHRLAQTLVSHMHEQVHPLFGDDIALFEPVAHIRVWHHDAPTPSADPHIDEFNEEYNTVRVVAAWPTGTRFAMVKRLPGVSHVDLVLSDMTGMVQERYQPLLNRQPWHQAGPGDMYLFSGLATVHSEPGPMGPNDAPRVLANVTYIPKDLEGTLIQNPYGAQR